MHISFQRTSLKSIALRTRFRPTGVCDCNWAGSVRRCPALLDSLTWPCYETRCLNDYGPLMLMKFVKNHLANAQASAGSWLGNSLRTEEKWPVGGCVRVRVRHFGPSPFRGRHPLNQLRASHFRTASPACGAHALAPHPPGRSCEVLRSSGGASELFCLCFCTFDFCLCLCQSWGSLFGAFIYFVVLYVFCIDKRMFGSAISCLLCRLSYNIPQKDPARL